MIGFTGLAKTGLAKTGLAKTGLAAVAAVLLMPETRHQDRA